MATGWLLVSALLATCAGPVAGSTALATAAPSGPEASMAAAPLPSPAQLEASIRRPIPGTSLAASYGRVPMVAWLEAETPGSRRVLAAAPPEAPPAALGPEGPGSDGLPAAAATDDGALWVVAARTRQAESRLWAQAWSNGRWREPVSGPSARRWDHHPDLAAGGGALWLAWIGEDGPNGDASLFASRWAGSGWTTAEQLPGAPGAPMAPSITVAGDGQPMVAWAASDGDDAEIWVTVRRGSGWTAPIRLTDNDVPDITPSIASSGAQALIAWSTFTPDGYLTCARMGRPFQGWKPVSRLSPEAGSHPGALFVAGRGLVVWEGVSGAPGTGILRAAASGPDGWQRVEDLGAKGGARAAIAAAPDGRVAVAWTQPDGVLSVAEASLAEGVPGRPGAALLITTVLAGPAPASIGALPLPTQESGQVPHNYLAFGDSITLGVVVTSRDPELELFISPGYPAALQTLLSAVLGPTTVLNSGVGGETTAQGLARIRSVIRSEQPDSLLLMEGTNDVTFAIDDNTIAFNLQQMIEGAQLEKAGILTFLGLLIPRVEPGDGFEGPGNEHTERVNALLPSVAETTGSTLVDTHTALDNQPALFSDHVHPTEEGYEVLAQAWFEGIEPVVLNLTNRGDVDGSGRVDGHDLVLLALAFGSVAGEPRYLAPADVNQDGLVDGFDLAILADFFGQSVAEVGS